MSHLPSTLTHLNVTQVSANHIGLIMTCFRFILQSKEEINNLLTDKQKTADEKIKELEVRMHTPLLIG